MGVLVIGLRLLQQPVIFVAPALRLFSALFDGWRFALGGRVGELFVVLGHVALFLVALEKVADLVEEALPLGRNLLVLDLGQLRQQFALAGRDISRGLHGHGDDQIAATAAVANVGHALALET